MADIIGILGVKIALSWPLEAAPQYSPGSNTHGDKSAECGDICHTLNNKDFKKEEKVLSARGSL